MEPTPPSRPSFALLGADAFLAARPATPVQLAHACTRGGYDAAIPASWGDELIAERCIERLSERTLGPAVFCACSLVRDRLLASGPDLAPFMLSFVAPPVAAARYLRQLYAGRPIDITYVGACPSADDEAIDRQVSPKAFFSELRNRGIILSQQPTMFNSTFAPDRRRCLSQPGGLPTPQLLERQSLPRELVEVAGFEYAAELAQHLIMSEPVLIDLATRSGCACSGAAVGIPPTEAHAAVVALEPPRSAQPIVDYDIEVPVDLPIPVPSADRGPPPPQDDPPRHDPPRGRPADRTERPVVDTSDFPDWPVETVERFTRPSSKPADTHTDVDVEFRAAPVVEAKREARAEPRLELAANFESQFDRAFREAFTFVPMALPIPRQPATETFDFPVFEREVPFVATVEATAEIVRRRIHVPRTRSAAGRTLPRAYVARRASAPPSGEVVVRSAPPAPVEQQAPAAPAPTPPVPVGRVSAPTMRSAATVTPPQHMPLFSAFAASGVLSAATEGDTGMTRESLTARARPAIVSVPDIPVPLPRSVETPRPRRKPPAIRPRVIRQPRGLSLIGHWLRQMRLRHLAMILVGLLTLAVGVAFALGYLPPLGTATGPLQTPQTAQTTDPAP